MVTAADIDEKVIELQDGMNEVKEALEDKVLQLSKDIKDMKSLFHIQ